MRELSFFCRLHQKFTPWEKVFSEDDEDFVVEMQKIEKKINIEIERRDLKVP